MSGTCEGMMSVLIGLLSWEQWMAISSQKSRTNGRGQIGGAHHEPVLYQFIISDAPLFIRNHQSSSWMTSETEFLCVLYLLNRTQMEVLVSFSSLDLGWWVAQVFYKCSSRDWSILSLNLLFPLLTSLPRPMSPWHAPLPLWFFNYNPRFRTNLYGMCSGGYVPITSGSQGGALSPALRDFPSHNFVVPIVGAALCLIHVSTISPLHFQYCVQFLYNSGKQVFYFKVMVCGRHFIAS